MENKVNERNKDSPLYDYLLSMVQKMDSTQKVALAGYLKTNSKGYNQKLFEQLDKGNAYQIALNNLDQNKKHFRESIPSLINEIIEFGIDKTRSKTFESLMKAESALRLGFHREGLDELKNLSVQLGINDFWIKWRILELQFAFSNLNERIAFNQTDSLYSFTKHFLSLGHFEEEPVYKYLKHSEFLIFLKTMREKDVSINIEFQNWHQNTLVFIERYNHAYSNKAMYFPLNDGANLDFLTIEYLNVVKETNKFILFALRSQLFDNKNNDILNKTKVMVQTLKSLSMNSFPFIPNAWPNSLTFYFFQLESELSLGLQLICSPKEWQKINNESHDPLKDVSNIASRIIILNLIGNILAIDSGYSSSFISKIELIEEAGNQILTSEQTRKLCKETDKLIKTSLKEKFGDYCYYSLLAIRVLLSDIYGSVSLQKDKYSSSYRIELNDHEYYKNLINGIELQPIKDCTNYFDFAIYKLYNLAKLKKNSQNKTLIN